MRLRTQLFTLVYWYNEYWYNGATTPKASIALIVPPTHLLLSRALSWSNDYGGVLVVAGHHLGDLGRTPFLASTGGRGWRRWCRWWCRTTGGAPVTPAHLAMHLAMHVLTHFVRPVCTLATAFNDKDPLGSRLNHSMGLTRGLLRRLGESDHELASTSERGV